MKTILVVGATGFVGRHLVGALIAAGHRVRCLVRTPTRAATLADRCEIVAGDITDEPAVERAVDGTDAVYVCIHTLSAQQVGGGFMDVEHRGLANVVTACRAHGTRRLVYLTSLGNAPDAPGAWARERWAAEQRVLDSGLDATVVQPGQIVGVGGQGFDMLVAQSKKRITVVLGRRPNRLRTIGIDDLVDAMATLLAEPRAHGLRLEVGSDDVLTRDEMIDVLARIVGRQPPWKLHLPAGMLAAVAPLVERIARLPRGAVTAVTEAVQTDLVGDIAVSRAILPRTPVGFEAAARRALSA